MNQSILTLDIRHLQRVGEYLQSQQKIVKRQRERLEWLGDAILRELVLTTANSVLNKLNPLQHADIVKVCDICCSNATLALAWDNTVGLTSYRQTHHSTKWKADIVETAIGSLAVDVSVGKNSNSTQNHLDEIMAVIFAVSIMGRGVTIMDHEQTNYNKIEPKTVHAVASYDSYHFDELGSDSDSDLDSTDEVPKSDKVVKNSLISDNNVELQLSSTTPSNPTSLTSSKSSTSSSIESLAFSTQRTVSIGGSAFQASLSLALFHQHLNATPRTLTHIRQNAMATKQQRWRIWEDDRIFDGTMASPIRISRISSFSGNVYEWVAGQMMNVGANTVRRGGINISSIDKFCRFLANGKNNKNKIVSSKNQSQHQQNSKASHSFWRYFRMPKSQKSAYEMLQQILAKQQISAKRKRASDSGDTITISSSRSSSNSSSSSSSSSNSNSNSNSNKTMTTSLNTTTDTINRESKKRKTEHKILCARGPSISKSNMNLLLRFVNSDVVKMVDNILHHKQTILPHVVILKEGLDRKICHALCAAHGVKSKSVNVNDKNGVNVRAVEIYDTSNIQSSVVDCYILTDLRKKYGM
jgi:hypothetical protein